MFDDAFIQLFPCWLHPCCPCSHDSIYVANDYLVEASSMPPQTFCHAVPSFAIHSDFVFSLLYHTLSPKCSHGIVQVLPPLLPNAILTAFHTKNLDGTMAPYLTSRRALLSCPSNLTPASVSSLNLVFRHSYNSSDCCSYVFNSTI